MATLKEIRNILSSPDGLAKLANESKKISTKQSKSEEFIQYALENTNSKTDASFLSGKFRGKKVSELISTIRGRKYLETIVERNGIIDEVLTKIIKKWIVII